MNNPYMYTAGDVFATQWFKNGDHPDDNCDSVINKQSGEVFSSEGKVVRYYRRPETVFKGERICPHCEYKMHLHGWIDDYHGRVVCPGDYIVSPRKDLYLPIKPAVFNLLYSVLCGSPG